MRSAGSSARDCDDPPPASSMESAPLQMANMQAGPVTSDPVNTVKIVKTVKVMCESVDGSMRSGLVCV